MARQFNGTNQALQSVSTVAIASQQLSLMCWMWRDSATFSAVLEFGNDSASGDFYILDGGGTDWHVNQKNGPEYFFARPSSGAWHQLIITIDRSLASDELTVYIDGVSRTLTLGTAGDSTGNFGARTLTLMDGTGGGLATAGRMAEIALWVGTLLNQVEVNTLWNSGAGTDARNVQNSTLAYYWQLCGTDSPETPLNGSINLAVIGGATSTAHPISGTGICGEPPPPEPPPPSGNSERSSFFLTNEFFGAQAYTDPAIDRNITRGLMNMLSLMVPCDAGMMTEVTSHPGLGFDLFMQGTTLYHSASTISTNAAQAANIANAVGQSKAWWTIMPEWDQGGGGWVPSGRPRYLGQTRQQAYTTFTNYYLNLTPLPTYLAVPITSRPIRLAAISDYSPNTFIAYQLGGLGVDVCMIERSIDELGDSSTGIAFMRGAARLYERPWGVDISTWRTSANSATEFSEAGVHTGGWTPSYLRRHMYIFYMGGGHVVRLEPTIYEFSNTTLNPFGQMVDAFGDFSLTRHPFADIGSPVVPMALMFDFFSGFDTKHGQFNQADGVWYQDIPYESGDHMINNFFKIAYPGHHLHGQTPGAPFGNPANTAQYLSFLAGGGDARPYEPMPTTRWGDTMDVTLNTASASVLSRYQIVALMGGVVIDTALRAALNTWVQAGGTLVVNHAQVSAADASLTGVTLGGALVNGGTTTWTPTGQTFTESAYTYRPVTLTTATLLATTTGGAPIITTNNVGAGKVILTTPDYLQNTARTALLNIGVQLFDHLNGLVRPAQVVGPAVQYMFNRAPGKQITTIINSNAAGTAWTGTVVASIPGNVTAVREWIADVNAPFTNVGGVITITASVPAWDLKIYAIEFQEGGGGVSRTPTNAGGVLTGAQPGMIRGTIIRPGRNTG